MQCATDEPSAKAAAGAPRTPAAMLRRAADVWREDGPLAVFDRILGETFYRRLWVFAKRLDEEIPLVKPEIPVECGRLHPAEVDDLAGFHPEVSVEEARARLQRGHHCYVARHAGRIVQAVWVGFGRVWVPYLGCWVELEAGDAYLYQSWTRSEYRRKGIAAARAIATLQELKKAGYRRAVAAIMPRAGAALGPPRLLGYAPCGIIGYYRLGPWRRPFYRPLTHDAPRLRLVKAGSEA